TIDLGTAFEMDGNIHHNATTASPCDWGNVNPPVPVSEGPACTTYFDRSGAINDLYVGKQDLSAFTTGSSDVNDIPNWGCTEKPFDAKDNILFAYGASFLESASADTANPTHRVVYFGQERESNNGDAFAGFWLVHNNVSCSP